MLPIFLLIKSLGEINIDPVVYAGLLLSALLVFLEGFITAAISALSVQTIYLHSVDGTT